MQDETEHCGQLIFLEGCLKYLDLSDRWEKSNARQTVVNTAVAPRGWCNCAPEIALQGLEACVYVMFAASANGSRCQACNARMPDQSWHGTHPRVTCFVVNMCDMRLDLLCSIVFIMKKSAPQLGPLVTPPWHCHAPWSLPAWHCHGPLEPTSVALPHSLEPTCVALPRSPGPPPAPMPFSSVV
jgi:hypothetical protein